MHMHMQVEFARFHVSVSVIVTDNAQCSSTGLQQFNLIGPLSFEWRGTSFPAVKENVPAVTESQITNMTGSLPYIQYR